MKLAPRAAIAAIAAAWLSLTTLAPAAADEGWVITSFQSDIRILPDSALHITENISVDFGSLSKHGIIRYIPLRYRYDAANDRLYEMSLQSVTTGSRPVPYTATFDGVNEVIRIGDPNRLVTSFNNYTITYSLRGVMNAFPDHDELYWNVDGAGWGVAKRSVRATVLIPDGSLQQAACYQGPLNSTESCTSDSAGAAVSYASTRQLASGEQMTLVLGLTKGAVSIEPPQLVPVEASPKQRTVAEALVLNPWTLAVSALILIVGVGLMSLMWWTHGRDREYLTQYYLTNDPRERTDPLFHHHVITPEFGPPQNLPPAILGLVLKERAAAKDVTASIVDLAVRGYLTISEVPGEKDWIFTWKGGGDMAKLLPYEMTLLGGIFSGLQQARLSLLKGRFVPTLKSVEKQIHEEAMSRRFFSTRPDIARGAWVGLGVAAFIFGGLLALLLGSLVGWGLPGLAVAFVGIVVSVLGYNMPKRTAAGSEVLQRTLGFRLYMTTAERYRQQFAEKAEIFTQLLPYAIVFGCVAMWAKAFEGLDTSASTSTWYLGAAPFQAALLSSNLESMDVGITSAIASTPGGGGASGFGGGGFAGGGGGGGGGGSW